MCRRRRRRHLFETVLAGTFALLLTGRLSAWGVDEQLRERLLTDGLKSLNNMSLVLEGKRIEFSRRLRTEVRGEVSRDIRRRDVLDLRLNDGLERVELYDTSGNLTNVGARNRDYCFELVRDKGNETLRVDAVVRSQRNQITEWIQFLRDDLLIPQMVFDQPLSEFIQREDVSVVSLQLRAGNNLTDDVAELKIRCNGPKSRLLKDNRREVTILMVPNQEWRVIERKIIDSDGNTSSASIEYTTFGQIRFPNRIILESKSGDGDVFEREEIEIDVLRESEIGPASYRLSNYGFPEELASQPHAMSSRTKLVWILSVNCALLAVFFAVIVFRRLHDRQGGCQQRGR
jgi:hypothetical protein